MNAREHVSPETRFLSLPGPLPLECGAHLEGVVVAYRSWGRLDSEGGNAVLVCHALTGSADVDRWWPGLLGAGRALDPARDFVVAANVLGGCYGTTGPGSPRRPGGEPWGPAFPAVTIRDQVLLQTRLLVGLGVRRLRLVVGGSMGGMQALEWAVAPPLPVERVAAIGAPARHSPWAIGLGEIQRRAIRDDPDWQGGSYSPERPPRRGLASARMLAMCTYRSPRGFELRFQREGDGAGLFQVESYLRYQGEKLAARFDANSYLTLTRAMDSHDLGRGRGPLDRVLGEVELPVLLLGIPSDVLYPPWEIEELSRLLPRAELSWIDSPHGHDAFLIEGDAVDGAIRRFRESEPATERRAERCA